MLRYVTKEAITCYVTEHKYQSRQNGEPREVFTPRHSLNIEYGTKNTHVLKCSQVAFAILAKARIKAQKNPPTEAERAGGITE